MRLGIKELRVAIRERIDDWNRRHPERGPCGAVAMAQWLTGYSTGIAFCQTRDQFDKDDTNWYNHWIGVNGSKNKFKIKDISGVYLEKGKPLYRSFDFGPHVWPADYKKDDVLYWYDVIKEAERKVRKKARRRRS